MGRIKMKFPQRIRLSLISKSINNSSVARDLGVSVGMVWAIRRGKMVADTPTGRKIRAELAKLSGKTVADIWPGMDT